VRLLRPHATVQKASKPKVRSDAKKMASHLSGLPRMSSAVETAQIP
jgi:hypothetical protein